jgi:hypothetical protein
MGKSKAKKNEPVDAEGLKNAGNVAYTNGKMQEAIKFYS